VIKRALNSVESEIKKNNYGVNSHREESSPVARDIYKILNDNRLVSIEELQKNSYSLPPVKFSPTKGKLRDNDYWNF
jgi:hypothetical protein